MNEIEKLFEKAVFEKEGKVYTSSQTVAERFGKQHKNVLRAITRLNCSEEFNRLNFELVEYVDEKGQKRPEFLMTKNGFSLLVFGFTGKEAPRFKEAYINAFDKMTKAIIALTDEKRLFQEREIKLFEAGGAELLLMARKKPATIEFLKCFWRALDSGKYFILCNIGDEEFVPRAGNWLGILYSSMFRLFEDVFQNFCEDFGYDFVKNRSKLIDEGFLIETINKHSTLANGLWRNHESVPVHFFDERIYLVLKTGKNVFMNTLFFEVREKESVLCLENYDHESQKQNTHTDCQTITQIFGGAK